MLPFPLTRRIRSPVHPPSHPSGILILMLFHPALDCPKPSVFAPASITQTELTYHAASKSLYPSEISFIFISKEIILSGTVSELLLEYLASLRFAHLILNLIEVNPPDRPLHWLKGICYTEHTRSQFNSPLP
ncbi:uncharacterized protein BO80DRAFT_97847 [Aspergillus ibericus CBS 121593]|uniref:Uncharacterized protein n=1 Tax=Aspergillus ibericus CBS 121593 TaxID=1448316 RepID=A0A395H2H9_9EURO|nr:hypothetical protein BO80DRAFT_97847 [Aspergillus ibericus CBS 121593]RAL00424.1 hypothetical protein BO80DRAFT_97847 [Aspergillus ibericus CBS 121593]